MQNKSGYILVLTLMILSLSTAIVTRIYYQASAYLSFADQFIKKEKSKSLALSGIQLALSRLSGNPEKIIEQIESGEKKEKLLLERILPSLNTWDVIELQEDQDGVTGKIQIYLACEEGKLNLNNIYDFNTHEFEGDSENTYYKNDYLDQFFAQFAKVTKNKIDASDAKKQLLKFLSKRPYQIIDPTELLSIEEFSYLQNYLFVEPLQDEDKPSRIYLMDLFTIFNSSVYWQPWVLSASTQALLGFSIPKTNDILKKEENVSQWLKGFQEKNSWNSDWDKTLSQVYGIEKNEMPKGFLELMDSDFNVKNFSVISYGTFGGITQKVYAIIKMQSGADGDTSFSVAKTYWI